MALKLLQSGIQPLGQFDALDAQTTTVLGGEVASFTYVSITPGVDRAAADVVLDGYVAAANTRPAATTTLVPDMRPLFLVDEGTSGYGTLFGEVVGGTTGKLIGGAVLGPHTATGSGKWTLWDKPGLYAVTLDAVDTTINSGLVPTNPALVGGDVLYATTAGLLTPNVVAAFEAVAVGRFIEFAPNASLVTTPASLTQALNSPTGSPALGAQFDVAIFHFNPDHS